MAHNTPDPTDRTDEPGRRVYATFVRALVEATGGKDPLDWQLDVLWNTMSPAERDDWNTKAGPRPDTTAGHSLTVVKDVANHPKPVLLHWHPGKPPRIIDLTEGDAGCDEHHAEEV